VVNEIFVHTPYDQVSIFDAISNGSSFFDACAGLFPLQEQKVRVLSLLSWQLEEG